MTWAFLRPRGILLHTPKPFRLLPALVSLGKEREMRRAHCAPVLCVAVPRSPRSSSACPGSGCSSPASVQQARGGLLAAQLSHGSLPSISLQLSFVVFAQPVHGG